MPEPIIVECPECKERFVAKTMAAADFLLACVDHPAPNLQPLEPKPPRCVEVGPHGWGPYFRCELREGHDGIHQAETQEGKLLNWARYDKWNPWYKEKFAEMGEPKQ